MINDIEMLNCILKNAEMGCQGITGVRRGIEPNRAVDNVLCEQLVRYGKIYNVASNMLKKRGAQPRHINPVARTMTRYAAKRDLQRDPSPSHAAAMMTIIMAILKISPATQGVCVCPGSAPGSGEFVFLVN